MIQKISLPIIIFIGLFAMNFHNGWAQKPKNELSICGGGGFYAFCPQPLVKGYSSKGFGGDAGMGYTTFFSPNWGLHTGLEFGFFNVKNKVNHLSLISPEQEDCEGYHYDLHTTLKDYYEIHKSFFLSIPLMLQYQTQMKQSYFWKKDNKMGFYALAGVKALLQFKYDYTCELPSINNTAYYPEFDNWIYSLPILGLGDFRGNITNGKLNFGFMAMFAFETGIKWRVGKNAFLYTGIFYDCGLNEPTKKARSPYNNDIIFEKSDENTLLSFADRLHLMAVGLKLRLAFFKVQTCIPCSYR